MCVFGGNFHQIIPHSTVNTSKICFKGTNSSTLLEDLSGISLTFTYILLRNSVDNVEMEVKEKKGFRRLTEKSVSFL